MTQAEVIYEQAKRLSPLERAQLIEMLFASLDKPDKEIEEAWSRELENRIDEYERHELKAVHLEEVLRKLK